MGRYTTVALVSSELKGQTIDSSSTPSSSEVEQWITEEESAIDLRTGQIWSSTAVSSSITEYDGSGYLRLEFSPIISISLLEYEVNGLGADSVSWSSLTEGRTNDYIIYLDEGEIKFFGSNIPTVGFKNIRWSGIYGYATTPDYIVKLATKMAARRYIETFIGSDSSKSGRSIAVGTIRMSSPQMFSMDYTQKLDGEIEHAFTNIVSAAHIFRPNRRYEPRC